MNNDFHSGFEKTAFIGAAVKTIGKSIGKGIWGLGKKLTTNVSPKGVRSFSGLKAGGSALGAGFGAMEVNNVINKTNTSVKSISGSMPSMKGSSFFKMR